MLMITLASVSHFEKIYIFISFLCGSLSADLIARFVQEWKVQIRARQWWWDEELWGADQMRSAMKDSIWTRLAEERENEENIWEKDNFGVLEEKIQRRRRKLAIEESICTVAMLSPQLCFPLNLNKSFFQCEQFWRRANICQLKSVLEIYLKFDEKCGGWNESLVPGCGPFICTEREHVAKIMICVIPWSWWCGGWGGWWGCW